MKKSAPKISAFLTIDTREQLPYAFADCQSPHVEFSICRTALRTGDYAAALLADASPAETIIIERKPLSDLYGTLSGDRRRRFEAELERMRSFGARVLLVEASLEDLVLKATRIHPSALIGSLVAFLLRYEVQLLFAGDRRYSESLTWRLCERWIRERHAAGRHEDAA